MGRKNLFAAVLILLLLFQPLPSVRAASRTGHITKDCTLSVSVDAENKRHLSDDNFLSIWRGGKKSTVRIDSPRAIGGLYIRWEKIPANWEVRSLKGEEPESLYNGAGSVFLHQYVPITSVGETSLELCLTSGGAIADLFVLADGDPVPDWVQRWKPMWDKADMLLVSTHADDELLWFGGAMPVYAGQFQKKVQVAYVTNHGPQRTHELLDGLWTVGVVAYPMISSFPDRYCKTFQQALEKYDENAVLEYQVSLLRRFKPDVVLGQDINGEYGHGVHQLNTYTLRKALEISDDPAFFPELAEKHGLWQVKKCYLHLYEKNRLLMDWNQPLSRFSGKTGLEMAKAGFACHVSQAKKGHWVVRDYGDNDCRKFGLYYTTVGPDKVGNDFFENLDACIPWPALSVEGKPPATQPPPTSPPTSPPTTQPPTTRPPQTTRPSTNARPSRTTEESAATAAGSLPTAAAQPSASIRPAINPNPEQGPRLWLFLLPGALLVIAGGTAAGLLLWRRAHTSGAKH